MEPRRWSAIAAATPAVRRRKHAPAGPAAPEHARRQEAFLAVRNIVIIVVALGALAGPKFGRDKMFESDTKAASVGDCLQGKGLQAGSRDEGHCFT
nr:hypothetical protein OG781_25885 [Streptomyces sp. NBC_00830]